MRSITRVCVGCLALGLLASPGCNSGPSSDPQAQVDLDVQPNSKNLVVGESATLFARTQDVYGRDAKIEWDTTAGHVETLENGRAARVQFDKPGMYTVTARLMIDGREVRRDSANINVKPLT